MVQSLSSRAWTLTGSSVMAAAFSPARLGVSGLVTVARSLIRSCQPSGRVAKEVAGSEPQPPGLARA